ncbi:hypothetical protein [Rosenbergiella epipactidis]|uniref:hypothetical protein n=1 Tax=Rosenbergiella epipactidis TaxID=1544694 RepID=UPI001F4D3992|nr:hypothetical protein [Rosenbergiella epipactidis]
MLDILQDLENAENRLISIGEIVDAIHEVSNGNYTAAASWLLMTFKALDDSGKLPSLVSLDKFFSLSRPAVWGSKVDIEIIYDLLSEVQKNNCLPFSHSNMPDGEYSLNSSIFEAGFEKSLIEQHLPPDAVSFINADVVRLLDDGIDSISDDDPLDFFITEIEEKADSGLSKKREDTLLEIIAALSLKIGRDSPDLRRSTGVNKSALGAEVAAILAKYCQIARLLPVTYTTEIGKALRLKANVDITPYLNLEGERQYANSHLEN